MRGADEGRGRTGGRSQNAESRRRTNVRDPCVTVTRSDPRSRVLGQRRTQGVLEEPEDTLVKAPEPESLASQRRIDDLDEVVHLWAQAIYHACVESLNRGRASAVLIVRWSSSVFATVCQELHARNHRLRQCGAGDGDFKVN